MNAATEIQQTETESDLLFSLTDLRIRILDREQRIDAHCNEAVRNAGLGIALVIEQGNDLIAAQKLLPKEGWMNWLKENFPKSDRTARDYMRLADNWQRAASLGIENATSIREAFKILGLIPDQQPQLLSDDPRLSIPPYTQKLNWLSEWVNKSREDILKLGSLKRQELKDRIKPLVDLYNAL